MFGTLSRASLPSVRSVMAFVQLFPTNVVDGATWPSDFEEKGTYAVQVC